MRIPTNEDRYDGLYTYRPESLFSLLEGEASTPLGFGDSSWEYEGYRIKADLNGRSLWLPIEYMK